MAPAASVDDYIDSFPPEVRSMLGTLREVARRALPDAEEKISYGIPAYRVEGVDVVYFAGWRHHVSLYPIPDVPDALATEMAPHRAGRGTLRFRLGDPLPMELIKRIVELLVEQRRPI